MYYSTIKKYLKKIPQTVNSKEALSWFNIALLFAALFEGYILRFSTKSVLLILAACFLFLFRLKAKQYLKASFILVLLVITAQLFNKIFIAEAASILALILFFVGSIELFQSGDRSRGISSEE